MQKIDDYLVRTHEQAIASLCDLLRIPSIATDPNHAADVERSADWTAAYLRRIGATAEVWPTAGRPAVYGEVLVDPKLPTVLIYGHHDVQPTGDLAKWSSPPFEPTVDARGRITARGSADNKGQFFLQIRALEAWMAAGGPPVNVKTLIEGEEEIGSPNLAGVLQERHERLKCDLVVVSDTPLWRPGRPAISLGTRGITAVEIRVTGPNRDLHSGIFGGSVPNPIAALSRMLASLHDDRGRIAIDGFYDDVKPISADLHGEWRRLDSELVEESREIGCDFAGEEGFSNPERRWLRPTIEINGIFGGYSGPGSNTIVPSWAGAKMTCRLVPDQLPERAQSLVVEHLRRVAPAGVKVEFILRKSGARPYSIRADHPALTGAARSMRDVYGVDPVRVREGLSLPILPMFKEILGADTVLLGFCDPACNAHSFDEFFDGEDLLRGSQVSARFMNELSKMERA